MVARVYGLEAGDYERILAAQGGVCPICMRAKGISRRLCVDHDHTIDDPRESVRGLLCKTCNHDLLGYFDIPALERAIAYLRNPPARAVLR